MAKKEKIKFDLLPTEIKHKLQNAMSWKQFYLYLGTTNEKAAHKCQLEIEEIMQNYGL